MWKESGTMISRFPCGKRFLKACQKHSFLAQLVLWKINRILSSTVNSAESVTKEAFKGLCQGRAKVQLINCFGSAAE